MEETKHTIIESWSGLKEDLVSFLSDTDAWIMVELKKAHRSRDWGKVQRVMEVMESVQPCPTRTSMVC